jgi:amino acid transporter
MTGASDERHGGLGTFGGVFTPSILTILGLVLFLRMPYVVGSVGLLQSLVILGLATLVSVLTTISLATVATNLKVRGGGEYFLISRTLGVEFGGAVGIVLYLAISVSVAFYAIGFAEAAAGAFDRGAASLIQSIAIALIVVLIGIALVGSDLATRLQYVVMALLVISLVSFFIGAGRDFDTDLLSDNFDKPDNGTGFWEAFAIFFPAVTGFSQGVAMSGDLRSPSRSITRGTFAAVGVSTIVYLAAIIVLAGSAPAATLVDETTTIMGDVSLAAWTILIGVLAATLSSALASSLGGPRVLQQLAKDRVLPGIAPFETGAGPMNNPRRAALVTAAIAVIVAALGDLNAVAPIISMFFLASYGLINYATYFEIRAASTSFRPRFRWYDRRVSLVGTAACGAAIVAINPIAGAAAGVVLVSLYFYLRRRDTPDRWNDSAGAYHFTQARKHLRRLDDHSRTRDWRPCMLVFVPRDPDVRGRMLKVASWMEGDVGYMTAVRVVEGDDPRRQRHAAEVEADLRHELDDSAPGSYARVLATEEIDVAVPALVQAHGIGKIRANIAVFGVRDLRSTDAESDAYGRMLHGCARVGTNVVITNVDQHGWETFESTAPRDRTIGLWWSDDKVGQLITLIAWLCKRDAAWSDARVIAHVPVGEQPDERTRVESLLEAARIRADVVEVEPTAAALADALGGTTLALAPLRIRRGRALGPFGSPLGMLLESLPIAIMTLATEFLDLDAEPDDELEELAELREQVERTRKWVAELDREASGKLVEAESRRIALEGVGDDDRDRLRAAVAEAEREATAAFRRYLDAKTRLEAVERRFHEMSPDAGTPDLDPAVWRSSPRD